MLQSSCQREPCTQHLGLSPVHPHHVPSLTVHSEERSLGKQSQPGARGREGTHIHTTKGKQRSAAHAWIRTAVGEGPVSFQWLRLPGCC